jgi:hypothetical protein
MVTVSLLLVSAAKVKITSIGGAQCCKKMG